MSITPSPEQHRIVRSESKRILVEANAGAAKTTTAAMRIEALIASGMDPSKIVALAFSEPGVRAYKAAFARLGMPQEVTSRLLIGTVDAFCSARLKKLDNAGVKVFTQAREVKPYVLDAIGSARTASNDTHPGEFWIEGRGTLSVEFLLDAFSVLKGTLGVQRYGEHFRCTPSAAADMGCNYTALAVFMAYEKARCGYDPQDGWMTQFRYIGDPTYDMALQLLSDDPPWSGENHPLALNLQAIVLDEMHDCGWAIFTVLRHLLERNPQAAFMGVGDRDQVIHGKHGADAYFMGPDLDREMGPVHRYPLTVTHRFGDAVAQPMASFSDKKYQTTNATQTLVSLLPASDAQDNAGLISKLISRYEVDAPLGAGDVAVLLRHPGNSVGIEHSLILNAIPYQTVGFQTFLQRPEIAFVRMLLSIALDHETYFMPESLLQAKRAVWQFIGANLPPPSTLEETETVIESASESNFKRFIFPKLLQEADKDVAASIVAALEIAETNDPLKVREFIQALRFTRLAQMVFVSQSDIEEAAYSMESLVDVAKHYASMDAMLGALNIIDQNQRKSQGKRHPVTLSTIEDAKGLEFRIVFIPDCNAPTFDGTSWDERNLFYVASTRVREHLMISYKKGQESSYLKHFLR
ncbi:MAG: ATP-dependent helicase [Hydrogenophaga sp.]|nr:ATP-dependent helicase [Hydrogenophaga sp.]